MTIELFGMARALAGCAEVEIAGVRTTKRELVHALAATYPQLIGNVVDVEHEAFVEPNMLLLDGRRAPDDDEPIGAADRPCVVFLASGG